MRLEKYKLSDLVKIIGGGTPKRKKEQYWNGNIPWLSVKDFNNNNRWVSDTEDKITEIGLNESSTKLLDEGDLIISARGTVGEISQLSKPMAFNQSCYGLKAEKKLTTNDFIYYWLKHNVNYVKNNTHGSVFDTITINTFDNLEVNLPSLQNQNRLTKVLTSLDEKIELNNSIISNLEELAQTLFKHWFVDFEFPNENGEPYKSSGGKMVESELGMMPEDWEAGILSEVAEIIMGQSPKSATYNQESMGTPLINGASDFKKDIINPLKYTTDPKRLSEKGDFLFGVRATVGNVTYVDQEYALGRGVGVARVTENKYKEFLYFQLIIGIEALKNSATGSVYINFTRKDLTDMKLLIADKKTISLFHDKTNSLLKEKKLLLQQNRILTDLRDTLLPKLLSGEIELPETMEVTDDVSVS